VREPLQDAQREGTAANSTAGQTQRAGWMLVDGSMQLVETFIRIT